MQYNLLTAGSLFQAKCLRFSIKFLMLMDSGIFFFPNHFIQQAVLKVFRMPASQTPRLHTFVLKEHSHHLWIHD